MSSPHWRRCVPISAFRPPIRTPVSRIVFRGTLSVPQRCFALAETLAHLDHLVLEDRARARGGDAVVYEAA